MGGDAAGGADGGFNQAATVKLADVGLTEMVLDARAAGGRFVARIETFDRPVVGHAGRVVSWYHEGDLDSEGSYAEWTVLYRQADTRVQSPPTTRVIIAAAAVYTFGGPDSTHA